jgi:hypothetical protein
MNSYLYTGGCHCHSVRFEVKLEKPLELTPITLCNCSMCEKTAYLHLIIPKTDVELLCDIDKLSNYQFNKKIAKHYFCKECGIKSFYQPRSHPDCWSINARCLDDFSKHTIKVKEFDGKNWEQNIHKIT